MGQGGANAVSIADTFYVKSGGRLGKPSEERMMRESLLRNQDPTFTDPLLTRASKSSAVLAPLDLVR